MVVFVSARNQYKVFMQGAPVAQKVSHLTVYVSLNAWALVGPAGCMFAEILEKRWLSVGVATLCECKEFQIRKRL